MPANERADKKGGRADLFVLFRLHAIGEIGPLVIGQGAAASPAGRSANGFDAFMTGRMLGSNPARRNDISAMIPDMRTVIFSAGVLVNAWLGRLISMAGVVRHDLLVDRSSRMYARHL